MKGLLAESRTSRLQGPLVPLICIWGACLVQSALVASREPLLVLAFPILTISILLMWTRGGYLPTAIVIAALLVPLELDAGFTSSINPAFLLTAAGSPLLGLKLTVEHRLSGLMNRMTVPLLGLGLTAVVAFGAGWVRTAGPSLLTPAPVRAQMAGLSLFLVSLGAVALALNPAVRARHRRLLVFTFLFLGGLYEFRFFLPIAGRAMDQVVSPHAVSGVFPTWVVALALGQALFNTRLAMLWRMACGGLVAVTLWSAFTFNLAWSTGWLPPLMAMAGIVWIASPRWGGVLLLAVVPIVGFFSEDLWQVIMVGDQQYSLTTRWEALKIIYPMVMHAPVLGLGMANYYYSVASEPILGWFVPFSSHNNYVDLAAQTGLLGVFFFFWFSWAFLHSIWRQRPRLEAGFEKAFLYACWGGWIGSLIAAGLADWVIPFVHNQGVAGFRASVLSWLFVGAAIACSAPSMKKGIDSA